MTRLSRVPDFPEALYEKVVVPYVPSDIGMYSRSIMRFTAGPELDTTNLQIDFDDFGNPVGISGVKLNIDEVPGLDGWHPVSHDFGDVSLKEQARVANEKKLLRAVVQRLPDVEVTLVNRVHEPGGGGRPVREVLAIRDDKLYGEMAGRYARPLVRFIDELAAEGKVLQVTAGHVINQHEARWPDGRISTTRQVEGRLHMPFPDRLTKWYFAPEAEREVMDLSRPATVTTVMRESGKFRENVRRVIGDARFWSGIAEIVHVPMKSGGYVGEARLDFFVDGLQVGSTHPQFRKKEPTLFDYAHAANTHIQVETTFDYDGECELKMQTVIDLDEFDAKNNPVH